jgi:hypothetical protein
MPWSLESKIAPEQAAAFARKKFDDDV